MPHAKNRLPVLQPKSYKHHSFNFNPKTHHFLFNTNKKTPTSFPIYLLCTFSWPSCQPLSTAIQIKPWLLPLFRLADHLLGTLAGLSSTRVSRRSCWENKVEFQLWISCKWRVVQTTNYVDMMFWGQTINPRFQWSWWFNNFHLPNILNPSKRTCKTLQGEHQPTIKHSSISPPATLCP